MKRSREHRGKKSAKQEEIVLLASHSFYIHKNHAWLRPLYLQAIAIGSFLCDSRFSCAPSGVHKETPSDKGRRDISIYSIRDFFAVFQNGGHGTLQDETQFIKRFCQ
ncbi:MAG: hypothetical protein E7199_03165 [Schwartzia succinivorans]|nr:hypothetical protein [Schwartzia succinivorans]